MNALSAWLLAAFLKIAWVLYQRYARREGNGIKRELETMARPFPGGPRYAGY
jgi:hypothetical protein